MYWLGIIRILIQLRENSVLMYFAAPFVLGKRVGLGMPFWLLFGAFIILPSFLLGAEIEEGKIIILSFVAYQGMMFLYWMRVATYLKKPLYLALLQFVPVVNIWAIWEMGSEIGNKSNHLVLENDYETQLVQWMSECLDKGGTRGQIEEQLVSHKLSKEKFIKLYKAAVALSQETEASNLNPQP